MTRLGGYQHQATIRTFPGYSRCGEFSEYVYSELHGNLSHVLVIRRIICNTFSVELLILLYMSGDSPINVYLVIFFQINLLSFMSLFEFSWALIGLHLVPSRSQLSSMNLGHWMDTFAGSSGTTWQFRQSGGFLLKPIQLLTISAMADGKLSWSPYAFSPASLWWKGLTYKSNDRFLSGPNAVTICLWISPFRLQ